MTTSTMPLPTVERVLPDLDPAVGAAVGDEILLDAVRSARVEKVTASGSSSSLQSHSARAWTMGGQVD